MKALFSLTLVSAMTVALISCGPSDAEKKADSLKVDSTRKEMHSTGDHMIDSMNAANEAQERHDDSVRKADSAHKADSAAAAKKGKK